MSLYALYLILIKQLQQKWGRFLLASGGIMVGIWAITLTTSLSLGLSSTITEAIKKGAIDLLKGSEKLCNGSKEFSLLMITRSKNTSNTAPIMCKVI